MNNIRLEDLLNRYLDAAVTDLELAELQDYINDPFYHVEIKNMIGQAFDQQTDVVELNEQEQAHLLEVIYAGEPFKGRSRKLWPQIMAIAAVVALVVAGVYFFDYNQDTRGDKSVVANDVAPGAVGATLTLDNGKRIKLADVRNGEIAREAGISVKKTAEGELIYEVKDATGNAERINRLSTANGETYILTLPDKTKVWLNAASSLTYSTNLIERGERRVSLDGEAYFEVYKDKAHPFIVQTAKQEVEVLGTHFNINSYADETAVATTLLEGAVKVTAGNFKKILTPGQQALSTGNIIEVSTVDVESVIDWKNGDFLLNRVDFRTAMRKIARWYNVEMVYDSSVPRDIQSIGYISRTKKLSAVLKLIEQSGQVHFNIQGRKVYVSK